MTESKNEPMRTKTQNSETEGDIEDVVGLPFPADEDIAKAIRYGKTLNLCGERLRSAISDYLADSDNLVGSESQLRELSSLAKLLREVLLEFDLTENTLTAVGLEIAVGSGDDLRLCSGKDLASMICDQYEEAGFTNDAIAGIFELGLELVEMKSED